MVLCMPMLVGEAWSHRRLSIDEYALRSSLYLFCPQGTIERAGVKVVQAQLEGLVHCGNSHVVLGRLRPTAKRRARPSLWYVRRLTVCLDLCQLLLQYKRV